jgi:hypothetical protein
MRTSKTIEPSDRAKLLLEYWKQSTQVQQHFNDISMKVRNFAVVVFSGFLTGVGLSIHNGIFVEFFNYKVSAAVLFAFVGLIVTQLIHFMDTYWYHVFLKSAVTETSNLESEIKRILKIEALSQAITLGSQNVKIISIFGIIYLPIGFKEILKTFPLRWIFKETQVDSSVRHRVFYRWLLAVIFFTGLASFFINPKTQPLVEQKTHQETSSTIKHIVSGDNVRLRSLPSFEAQILKILPVGQRIKILEDLDSSWLKVEAFIIINDESKVGYVHRDFIGTLKP